MPKLPVKVVTKQKETDQLTLEFAELSILLLQKDVKDREIIVISIAGAFRKGKSLILNFFLKYLNKRYVKKSTARDWLKGDNECLTGFESHGGSNRVTTGIQIWPEVFKHDSEDGRKLAIVLLDTQGMFDSNTTMRDNTTIFGLSTLMSSVQVFNIMHNIAENDLHHLQLFSEYSKFVAGKNVAKPFQKLMFLIRDWQYPDEKKYGSAGGQEYLEEYLGIDDKQKEELKEIRKRIRSGYDDICCFLMPYPGEKVSTNQNFNGNLKDFNENFKTYVQLLVPEILSPENLVVKKIGDSFLTCADFLEYFKQYFKTFVDDDIPVPETLMAANARAHNNRALMKSKEHYAKKIRPLFDTTFKEIEKELLDGHNRFQEEAVQMLENVLMESPGIEETKNELKIYIFREFEELLNRNSAKFSLLGLSTVATIAAGAAAVTATIVVKAL